MPTGYTAPILEGKITNFKDYAKLCMRAFGATIHMRDESLETEYVKRTPDNYHTNSLKKYQERFDELTNMSDEELFNEKTSEIKKNIEYRKQKFIEENDNRLKLLSILEDVDKWKPPTEEHQGIKKFMREQITETLKYDAEPKYHELQIKEYEEKLGNINVSEIREEYFKDIKQKIKYQTEQIYEEIKRVDSSNKWVETFLNSL